MDGVVHGIRSEVGAGRPDHSAQLDADLLEDVRITERFEHRTAHLRALEKALQQHSPALPSTKVTRRRIPLIGSTATTRHGADG